MFEPNEEFAPSGKKSVLSFAISRLRGAKTVVAFGSVHDADFRADRYYYAGVFPHFHG